MKNKVFVLACYDIADERRLQKVAKIMEDYGVRVLYSVFECLLSRGLFAQMKSKVKEVLDPHEDSVIYYLLCNHCRRKIEHLGRTPFYLEEVDSIVV